MSWWKKKQKSVTSVQEKGDRELELLEKKAHEMSQGRVQKDRVCDAQYEKNIDSGMSKNEAMKKYTDCKFPELGETGRISIGGKRWPGRSHKRRRRKSRRKSKRKSTKKKRRKRRKSTKKKRRRRRRR